MDIKRLGVLGSGGGTNYQSIQDSCDGKEEALLHSRAQTAVVISNNSKAGILERARTAGVPAVHLSSVTHPDPDRLDAAIKNVLCGHGVDLVLLAGYMKPVGPQVLGAYPNRILNIHPAFDLVSFGGEGFYGIAVHRAVLAAADKKSGASVHVVDDRYDHGPVVARVEVPVLPDDTPETLAARVLVQEHRLYPFATGYYIETKFVIPERPVRLFDGPLTPPI